MQKTLFSGPFGKKTTGRSGTVGAEPKKLKMMPFDRKTGLSGDQFFQDGKITVAAFHGLGAYSADEHMGMPGPGDDKPVLPRLLMDPFQVAHILQGPDGPVHGCLTDLLRRQDHSHLGNRQAVGIFFKYPPYRLALRGKSQTGAVELAPEFFY